MKTAIVLALAVVALAGGCAALGGGLAKSLGENQGILELTVNVKGAEVSIDGALAGSIVTADKPQDFVVEGGPHEVVVKKPGFVPYQAAVRVAPAAINTLAVTLERLPAMATTPAE